MAASDALLLAAAVESNSEHPLGSAIVAFAQAIIQQRQPNGQQAGGKGSGSVPLLACRDVQVAVGQGIAAWVQVPQPPYNGSDNGSAGSAGTLHLQSRDALLRLQLAATGGHAAAAPSAVEAEALALEAAAAGAAAAPAEVRVAVGSRRLMAAEGLGVPPATEAYMHEQEVTGAGVLCAAPLLAASLLAASLHKSGRAQPACSGRRPCVFPHSSLLRKSSTAPHHSFAAAGPGSHLRAGGGGRRHRGGRCNPGPAETRGSVGWQLTPRHAGPSRCHACCVAWLVLPLLPPPLHAPLHLPPACLRPLHNTRMACRGVVAALAAQGLTPVLLTGDNWRTARAIASQLGIPEVAGAGGWGWGWGAGASPGISLGAATASSAWTNHC